MNKRVVNAQLVRFGLLLGSITDLVVSSGEQEFVQTGADKAIGTGVAATLALSGLAGAATGAMLSVSGSADAVQFFTCTVGGHRIAGRFSKVWFENGDIVEVVGEPQRDGSFAVYAVRRAGDSTLWMYPHCSRGRRAHWVYALKMIPVGTAVLTALGSLFIGLFELFSDEKSPANFLWFMFWLYTGLSLVVGLYFPLKIGRRWRPFVDIAEKIFSALGYENPSQVDMEKQNSIYWKKLAKPSEPRRVAPWVFRYVDKA